MDVITLLIAIIGLTAVLVVRPVYGLIVTTVLYMWYPYDAGRLSLGTIDFSVGRVAVIGLVLKAFFTPSLTSRFKAVWLDGLVIILFLAEIATGLTDTTVDFMRFVEYRMGDFCDMALPYFAVRLIIRSKEDYISLLKAFAWTAAGLSLVAMYESLTGENLLRLGRTLGESEVRLKFFHRAAVTFRHSIYFGVFSGMAGAICMGLIGNVRRDPLLYKILAGTIFLGAFASMSSGGLLAMAGALFFLAVFRYRSHWKTALVTVAVMCLFVEIVSNRHFYNVVDRLSFNSSTAWYRARLFEVAFFEGGMANHWFTGYGLADPGWGPRIDMRGHTDMVNHYLMQLARYGLVGFIPFCVVIVSAFRNLFRGFWLKVHTEDAWLIWCIAGGLFGVLLSLNSVSLFEQPMVLLFMTYAFCATLPPMLEERRQGAMARGDNVPSIRTSKAPASLGPVTY
jgi:hypothetical protein